MKGFLKILISLIVIILAGFGVWALLDGDDGSGDNAENQSESVQVDEATEDADDQAAENDDQAAAEPEPETVDNDYFTLELPTGFEQTSDRLFTYTGTPGETFSYINQDSGEYFEVNRQPAQSGVNPDFIWNYTYSNGDIVLDKPTTDICNPSADDFCTSAGDGRLDAFIGNSSNQTISGERYYFTFGNVQTETVSDLSFVDDFTDNLSFN